MPFDPNTPRSRDEVLLQAIVSGDSSAMGDPRDREEEFVKAIADKETLPDYSEASVGDVLQIGSDGPEWSTPSQTTYYQHEIRMNLSNANIVFYVFVTIINTSPTPIADSAGFNAAIRGRGGYIPCTGIYTEIANNTTFFIMAINGSGSTTAIIKYDGGTLDSGTISINSITEKGITNSNHGGFIDNVKIV